MIVRPSLFKGNPWHYAATPACSYLWAHHDLWKYEVICLHAEGSHGDDAIMEASRQSLKPLKGEAAHVAMQLGPKTTINHQ